MLLFGLHPVMVRVTIHANVAITAGQHCSFAAPLDPNCHRWDHRPQPLEKAGVAVEVCTNRYRLETRCCKYFEQLHHRDGPQAASVRRAQLNID